MSVDWALAGKLGGTGFATVLIVLAVLAGAIWLAGTVIRKIAPQRNDAADNKRKGA